MQHSLNTPVAIAYGDGIGPEILRSTLEILQAAGARIDFQEIEVGEKQYLKGHTSGISPEAWQVLRSTKVFLKAPITTPQGTGYKSLNVTIRKSLGLFANVRPCMSYHPFITTHHPEMDVVIIRENEEDLYAGIEHQQTDEVTQCLKLISKPGIEKIVRFAFEYARVYGRKKVSCFTKDNIMKITDGLFHRMFDEIGNEYPEIKKEHYIVDIGAARLADTPEIFDVVVMPNLYGDILSDVAAQITGSVGLGGSANIGSACAMFEAIHGSAPDIAGQDVANPSGILLGAVQMLVYIGQHDVAQKIHNAWLKTIEDGIHTRDIFREGKSKVQVGTRLFTKAVIERLGEVPQQLPAVTYTMEGDKKITISMPVPKISKKELVGVDVFLHWNKDDRNPEVLGNQMSKYKAGHFALNMITNRGVKVYPGGIPETFCTDHWRCRFVADAPGKYAEVLELCGQLSQEGFDIIKTENLYNFDGKAGYSLGQGQ